MEKTEQPRRSYWPYVVAVLLTAAVTFAVTALLTNIIQHKVEAKNPYVRLVEVDEDTTDPAEWGKNWPREYNGYLATAEPTSTKFGGGRFRLGASGSEALPAEKAEKHPWLTRLFAGYAFAIDYRDRRGHAYMLQDQEQTKRVTERKQPGSCLHCHGSVMPLYRQLGNGDTQKGLEATFSMTYTEAHDALARIGSSTHDGKKVAGIHPVSCVDCHDPKTMELRVTRPGFIKGISLLAASSEPTPHLPSIEKWRSGPRTTAYDPNHDSSRQEMRSFVCGQCHVEYYCGPKMPLTFPWGKGLKVEQIEAFYDELKFPDGSKFYDWQHAETGAKSYKAQHPEFEMWSQGVHARSGVACADCHMPYTREGAMKVSDHHVRSPLLMVNRSCQVCHHFSEEEMTARVGAIQDRTYGMMQRTSEALIQYLDEVKSAKTMGATEEELHKALDLQRKGAWRLDFVAAENSMGFHAPAEAVRILGESIDYFRQGQLEASKVTARHAATQPAK